MVAGYALRPDLTARPSRLSVQRGMSAAPSALFRCWTDRFDDWFAAPGTLIVSTEVGAPFFFEAREQQRRVPHFGRLLRVQADQLLEFTWSTCATQGEETVVTVELSAEGKGTRLRLSHEGFPDERSRERHETAWPSILAELDRLSRIAGAGGYPAPRSADNQCCGCMQMTTCSPRCVRSYSTKSATASCGR